MPESRADATLMPMVVPMPMLEIYQVPADSPDAQAIMAELDAELRERYQGAPIHSLLPGEASSPLLWFFMLRAGGQLVGCGALRRPAAGAQPAGVGEIKRMFIRPQHRRQGYARVLLLHLEALAKDNGMPTVRLETGIAQPEALALYRKAGYTEIPLFARHQAAPHSLCFQKELSQ